MMRQNRGSGGRVRTSGVQRSRQERRWRARSHWKGRRNAKRKPPGSQRRPREEPGDGSIAAKSHLG